jgi:hypothetical protein
LTNDKATSRKLRLLSATISSPPTGMKTNTLDQTYVPSKGSALEYASGHEQVAGAPRQAALRRIAKQAD